MTSEQETASIAAGNQPAGGSPPPAVQEGLTGDGQDRPSSIFGGLMRSSVGRNLGLVVALFVLCLVGVATAVLLLLPSVGRWYAGVAADRQLPPPPPGPPAGPPVGPPAGPPSGQSVSDPRKPPVW